MDLGPLENLSMRFFESILRIIDLSKIMEAYLTEVLVKYVLNRDTKICIFKCFKITMNAKTLSF